MRELRRGLATGLVMLAVGACGGSNDAPNGADAGRSPPAVDAFAAAFGTAWCGLLARCCVASGGTVIGACETETAARQMRIAAEASADGAAWDGAAAAHCLDAVDAAPCDTDLASVRELSRACDTWVGTVPPSGACMTGESCEEPAPTAVATCVGSTCQVVVLRAPGESCSEPSLTCDPLVATCATSSGGPLGTCTALPGAGEACTASCRAGFDCAPSGLCAPLGRMGATCDVDGACVSRRCSAGRCAGLAEDDYCTLP